MALLNLEQIFNNFIAVVVVLGFFYLIYQKMKGKGIDISDMFGTKKK